MSQTPSQRPLTLTDSQIFELVQEYYVVNKAADNFNVDALFSVVSDIMTPSIAPADPTIKTGEDYEATNFEPPVQTLKHIACQMMNTPYDEYHSHAHETTMSILEQLKSYSLDAKAVIALAAFSLEYGNFWHLSQVPRDDNLGRSLALLNHVGGFERNRRAISEYNFVVKNFFESVKSIVELERIVLKQEGYDDEEKDHVPTLTEAMRELPVFVYWVVLSIVASALHINCLLSDSEGKYDLSDISSKISTVLSKLKALLGMIRKEIAHRDEYLRSHRVLHTPADVVEVLLAGSEDISE